MKKAVGIWLLCLVNIALGRYIASDGACCNSEVSTCSVTSSSGWSSTVDRSPDLTEYPGFSWSSNYYWVQDISGTMDFDQVFSVEDETTTFSFDYFYDPLKFDNGNYLHVFFTPTNKPASKYLIANVRMPSDYWAHLDVVCDSSATYCCGSADNFPCTGKLEIIGSLASHPPHGLIAVDNLGTGNCDAIPPVVTTTTTRSPTTTTTTTHAPTTTTTTTTTHAPTTTTTPTTTKPTTTKTTSPEHTTTEKTSAAPTTTKATTTAKTSTVTTARPSTMEPTTTERTSAAPTTTKATTTAKPSSTTTTRPSTSTEHTTTERTSAASTTTKAATTTKLPSTTTGAPTTTRATTVQPTTTKAVTASTEPVTTSKTTEGPTTSKPTTTTTPTPEQKSCSNFESDWSSWSAANWKLSESTKPVPTPPQHGSNYAWANTNGASLTSGTFSDVSEETIFSLDYYVRATTGNGALNVYFRDDRNGNIFIIGSLKAATSDVWQLATIDCTAKPALGSFGCCYSYPCSGELIIEALTTASDSAFAVDDISKDGACKNSLPCCYFTDELQCGYVNDPQDSSYGWLWSGNQQPNLANISFDSDGWDYVWFQTPENASTDSFTFRSPPVVYYYKTVVSFRYFFYSSNSNGGASLSFRFYNTDESRLFTISNISKSNGSEFKGGSYMYFSQFACPGDYTCSGYFEVVAEPNGNQVLFATDAYTLEYTGSNECSPPVN